MQGRRSIYRSEPSGLVSLLTTLRAVLCRFRWHRRRPPRHCFHRSPWGTLNGRTWQMHRYELPTR